MKTLALILSLIVTNSWATVQTVTICPPNGACEQVQVITNDTYEDNYNRG